MSYGAPVVVKKNGLSQQQRQNTPVNGMPSTSSSLSTNHTNGLSSNHVQHQNGHGAIVAGILTNSSSSANHTNGLSSNHVQQQNGHGVLTNGVATNSLPSTNHMNGVSSNHVQQQNGHGVLANGVTSNSLPSTNHMNGFSSNHAQQQNGQLSRFAFSGEKSQTPTKTTPPSTKPGKTFVEVTRQSSTANGAPKVKKDTFNDGVRATNTSSMTTKQQVQKKKQQQQQPALPNSRTKNNATTTTTPGTNPRMSSGKKNRPSEDGFVRLKLGKKVDTIYIQNANGERIAMDVFELRK
jgi:hypothetical protein